MRKLAMGIFGVAIIMLLVGCQDKYDSSIHEVVIAEIQNEIGSDLSKKVEKSIIIEKTDGKKEYENRGEINDYRIKFHIKDIDERNGNKYTKHELWSIVYRIDQVVSSNRLVGRGTPSEGAYNGAFGYLGDDMKSFSDLTLNYFGDQKITYQEFMTSYYDEYGNPVFYGSYRKESENESVHKVF